MAAPTTRHLSRRRAQPTTGRGALRLQTHAAAAQVALSLSEAMTASAALQGRQGAALGRAAAKAMGLTPAEGRRLRRLHGQLLAAGLLERRRDALAYCHQPEQGDTDQLIDALTLACDIEQNARRRHWLHAVRGMSLARRYGVRY